METSKRPKFSEYPALQNPALEIRLLTLLPNPDDSAPIEVELRASQLEHVEDEYIALSYAWGDPNNTAPITINGHGHHVTVNLQSALRHLRLPSEMVTLWVDAVCINQDDDAEKSSQVQQMGRIYRSAELVIAWLGEAADD
ncbi:heterokaryon incompatibility protein-domain-containing protein, partial [Immersiella caudata]